jgi:hypothetical protein
MGGWPAAAAGNQHREAAKFMIRVHGPLYLRAVNPDHELRAPVAAVGSFD